MHVEELNRCFVGIRLPQEAQTKLADVQLAIRHKAGSDVVRWSNPSELQIILLPLGELLVARVHQVQLILPSVAAQFRPFEITIEGLGGSPSALQPRFPSGEHAGIEELQAGAGAGFQVHIELGRIKTEAEAHRTALGRAIKMTSIGCVWRMRVTQFDLFRSTTTNMGPQLVTINSYPFPSC